MDFSQPLIPGVLVRRYQRFLADVALDDAATVTVHCPNTGSMLGCCAPGSRVWLSRAAAATRKYPHTWEIVQVDGGTLVGINTGVTSRLVREAVAAGVIDELHGYAAVRPEVRFGEQGSRVDLLMSGPGRRDCYVEIKNVTAAVHGGAAVFPDAVTSRGTKHLQELMLMVERGHRAALIFCIQRDDVQRVEPADDIDPLYGRTLRMARDRGVEVIAYRARVSPAGVTLYRPVPVHYP